MKEKAPLPKVNPEEFVKIWSRKKIVDYFFNQFEEIQGETPNDRRPNITSADEFVYALQTINKSYVINDLPEFALKMQEFLDKVMIQTMKEEKEYGS